MKNCKRDITLNEESTIEDMLAFERGLLRDYAAAVFAIESKEARELVLASIKELAEDTWLVNDLLSALDR